MKLYASIILFTITFTFAQTPINNSTFLCPAPCACDSSAQSALRVDCHDRHLPQVPAALPPATHHLLLSNNELKRLTLRQLEAAAELTHLDASNNSLQNLEIGVFRPLPRLQTVDLSFNPLSHLPYGIFAHLPQLQSLFLAHCHLTTLNNATFFKLPALTALHLHHNALSTVSVDAFWNLHHLKALDLSNNELTSLAPQWFYNLPLLEKFFVSHNRLAQIDDSVFKSSLALRELDLAHNELSEARFLLTLPSSVRFLNLAANNFSLLPSHTFQGLAHLEWLNLNDNPLTHLAPPLFHATPKLEFLFLSRLRLRTLGNGLLDAVTRLRQLEITENPWLSDLDSDAFYYLGALQELNVSYNALQVVPRSLRHLPQLRQLDLQGNQWQCNCHSYWVLGWANRAGPTHQLEAPKLIDCQMPDGRQMALFDGLNELRCTAVRLEHSSVYQQAALGSQATLTCQFAGFPAPQVQWHLPGHRVLYWPGNATGDDLNQTHFEPSGDLVITPVGRQDGGRYICVASNPLSNVTAFMTLHLNPAPIRRAQVMSLFVGLACVVGFILCALIGRGLKMILDRCGWWNCYACCGERLTPRAKQVRTFLEGIESYKKQQLDRLRENYHGQAQRIKENCMQQVDRLRDSYTTQVNYLRGVRDSGSQHLTLLRDQYNEQVRRVYNYSMQSMDGVRTNYVSQRNRVRKFSAHQLVRLKESYRFQQKTINKILENLPSMYIDSCRNPACARTDSIYFDDDIAGLEVVDTYIKSTLCTLKELEEEVAEGSAHDRSSTLDSRESTPGEEVAPSAASHRTSRPSHSRQGSLGSLDLSNFLSFPPLTLPHRLSRHKRQRKHSGRGVKQVQVAVEVCQEPNSLPMSGDGEPEPEEQTGLLPAEGSEAGPPPDTDASAIRDDSVTVEAEEDVDVAVKLAPMASESDL